ncbi:hypothetical protein IFM89_029224 [Coptis chinensis]|uniref:Uncharacterized protein n=1 Tax=Coptis chinensis TaxID=261450 RepID=A0A835IRD8_9MAGN|nr:hypothetical protein IFM89_029224 [Coptis chinensis]
MPFGYTISSIAGLILLCLWISWQGIAKEGILLRFDLMNISAMGSIVVKAGDILIVPLPDAWENSWSSLTLTSTRKFVGA